MIDPANAADEVLTIVPASGTMVPALFDSPHSGSLYPADFNAAIELIKLRRMEDAFVDELFAAAPANGAQLIAARFPRGYIDPNRTDDDIDPAEIAGWTAVARPTEKSRVGKGLVWTRLHGLEALYDRQLTASEIQHRIDAYWRPYHAAVAEAYDTLHGQFGCVYHVDCHSMRAQGNAFDPDGEAARADFVVSNHDGASCDPDFLDLVVSNLRGAGFNAAINDPYKGAELTKRYADPALGRHSLQIEINRRLYMDEMTIEKSAEFPAFKAHIDSLVAAVCSFAAEKGA